MITSGVYHPQNGQQYQGNPQKAHSCTSLHRLSHHEIKKAQINKIFVIFHPFAQKPPRPPCWRICTKFGTAVGVANVITSNKFFVIGQGMWILRGSKIALSHWQSQLPLTQRWCSPLLLTYYAEKGLWNSMSALCFDAVGWAAGRASGQ